MCLCMYVCMYVCMNYNRPIMRSQDRTEQDRTGNDRTGQERTGHCKSNLPLQKCGRLVREGPLIESVHLHLSIRDSPLKGCDQGFVANPLYRFSRHRQWGVSAERDQLCLHHRTSEHHYEMQSSMPSKEIEAMPASSRRTRCIALCRARQCLRRR